jgi:ribosomal protein S18 acetylase RimI-like enzyme
MNIREAEYADTDKLAPMILQACAHQQLLDPQRYGLVDDLKANYRRWFGKLAEDPRMVVLVAEEDHAILGFLLGSVEKEAPIYRVGEYAIIHDVWVNEAYRQRGVGAALIKAAQTHFASMGMRQMRVETVVQDRVARHLLESCGFRVSTTLLVYEPPAPRRRKKSADGNASQG